MNKWIRHSIGHLIEEAVKEVKKDHSIDSETLSEFRVEPTRDVRFGDVSSNIALLLAGKIGKSPREVGNWIIDGLNRGPGKLQGIFEKVEIGGAGFINFTLGDQPFIAIIREILDQVENFGRGQSKPGKIMIEFVSANPTGPLTLAHARQAAVGDSLARILRFSGFSVDREYYLNDRGRQMMVLGHSVFLRYQELLGRTIEFPEDFYQGDYIRELAADVLKEFGDRFLKMEESESAAFFSKYAREHIMEGIQKDLSDFDVTFECFFSEKDFVSTGRVETCLNSLKSKGFAYEAEGAIWLRSTDFGDDKDRVLVRSNGEMTYIMPDAAYHDEKFSRGYHRLVNIWGPDHHGYVARLKAAMAALGRDPKQVDVIILQLATLFEGGKKLSMSTRRGEFVTLRQVMDDVGKDVSRYFFIMRRTNSHLDFDLDLAKKQSVDNPVYYIQYAHARIHSIIQKYREERGKEPDLHLREGFASKLESEEIEIIKKLGFFEETIETCCEHLDPYPLGDYLLKVAQLFHSYYAKHRVILEDDNLTRSRLTLVRAIQIVIKSGLDLLGIRSPDVM